MAEIKHVQILTEEVDKRKKLKNEEREERFDRQSLLEAALALTLCSL